MSNFNLSALNKITFLLILLVMSLVPASSHAQSMCGDMTQATLLAGQNIPAGLVTVENDEQYLYVTYQADENWLIVETHLDVATSPEALQQTRKGNAVPGRFAYKSEHDPGVTTVIHNIELSDWPAGSPLYIAAHAVVISPFANETAWAEGEGFPGNDWAMYTSYHVQTCEAPPPVSGVINLEPAYVGVWENEVSISLTLTRSGGSEGEVVVYLESFDITATVDHDYEMIPDAVIFEDGETEKTLVVYIIDDYWQEIHEEFIVQIVSVTGADVGDNVATAVKIYDDDYTGD